MTDLGLSMEFAGRLKKAEEKIERLETLEFGQVAGGSIFLIERITVSGAPVAAIIFDSIPPIAHQLWLVWYAVEADDGTWTTYSLRMRLNNDSGINYDWYLAWHEWNNLHDNANGWAADHAQVGFVTDSDFKSWIGHILFPCYATESPESMRRAWICDAFGQNVYWDEMPYMEHRRVVGGGRWDSNLAINRIDLYLSGGGTFAVGSCFSLYGMG